MLLSFHRRTGAQIADVFEPLAELRIAVFRHFPYLYDGTVEYELDYLQTYANSPRAFLLAAYDGSRMVGATTCIPLTDETPDVQAPFVQAGFVPDEVFYFGESMLLPEYRGLGVGHRFFDEREAHAGSFGTFRYTCFCAVVRPDDHPLRPADYRPLDAFWHKRGYRRASELHTTFAWPDLGEEVSTAKAMVFWLRPLE